MLAFEWTQWWGTLPEWLAALGTVGAFFAGLRLLRKELETRREDVEDRRRAQARLVSAWATIRAIDTSRFSTAPAYGWAITAKNGSDEPVYNVLVQVFMFRTDIETLGSWNKSPTNPTRTLNFGLIPPQSDDHRPLMRDEEYRYFLCSIMFRDSQGYLWERLPTGTLQLIEGPRT